MESTIGVNGSGFRENGDKTYLNKMRTQKNLVGEDEIMGCDIRGLNDYYWIMPRVT